MPTVAQRISTVTHRSNYSKCFGLPYTGANAYQENLLLLVCW